ncbi:DHH phosphoesterase [Daedalea quercina L-15889]|uniref:DHH phosphoesterase n=1 Tax=Daedalea quercina L-15889 TaxID=1314783 RepID=A0A165PQW5_9APHY|nr:DHH phosphoesterase [Daedalea quercina L-15889]
MNNARVFIQEWYAPTPHPRACLTTQFTHSASAHQPTLLLPDKDADGLCSGLILHATLTALGLPPTLIHTHFVAKGSNVHAPAERARIAAITPCPRFVVVADQGSRPGPALLCSEDGRVKTLIVDHHLAQGFPEGALALSAAACEPVATSSTLAYLLCEPLVRGIAGREVQQRMEWLCVLGTMGDLGAGHKWERPWPDMSACTKWWTKKVLGDAVALVNAPRRTARYDVLTAWSALLSNNPAEIASTRSNDKHIMRLHDARLEIRAETERCGHTAPTFSGDGRVALVRIQSEAQVHPLIATRWASTLKSSRLQIVMCANSGYLPGAGMTNFACRVARCALPADNEAQATSIPDVLRAYAARVPGLMESMGDDFARGHAQASGGIVSSENFERLWEVMRNAPTDETGELVSVSGSSVVLWDGRTGVLTRMDCVAGPQKKKRKTEGVQKNTLEGWIKR